MLNIQFLNAMGGPKAPKFLPPAAVGAEIDRTAQAANVAKEAVQVLLVDKGHTVHFGCSVFASKAHNTSQAVTFLLLQTQDATQELEMRQNAQASAQAALLEQELSLQSLKGKRGP